MSFTATVRHGNFSGSIAPALPMPGQTAITA
jgi:hypothetical protein